MTIPRSFFRQAVFTPLRPAARPARILATGLALSAAAPGLVALAAGGAAPLFARPESPRQAIVLEVSAQAPTEADLAPYALKCEGEDSTAGALPQRKMRDWRTMSELERAAFTCSLTALDKSADANTRTAMAWGLSVCLTAFLKQLGTTSQRMRTDILNTEISSVAQLCASQLSQ